MSIMSIMGSLKLSIYLRSLIVEVIKLIGRCIPTSDFIEGGYD